MNCVRLLKQNLFTTQVVELENVYREDGYVYPTHPRVPKWVIEKRLNKNIVHYRDVFVWVYVDSGDMRKKFDSKVIPVEKIIKNALKPDKVN